MLVLIGESQSKRTGFMKKAADSLGISLQVLTWEELQNGFDAGQLRGAAVKIDPPSFSAVFLEEMQAQLHGYIHILQKLAKADCVFLNSPEAVIRLLDKKQAKADLQKHGIPVTQMFAADIRSAGQLLEFMQDRRCYSVFVKPRYFSGAAGVAAFRINPARKEMLLYTSCCLERRQAVNTKKLYRMQDSGEICRLLDCLLSMECVVERWHPKAEIHGKSCDLRAVYQFGHIAHIVVRCSKGPVTNLHLNNEAAEIQELGLGEQDMQGLEELCSRAVSVFPGLAMAGIDILLEKETLRPLVIEMNGQGDLIYQDIYRENKIYREQAGMLCRQ